DAQELLAQLLGQKLLTAHGVVGFFPAAAADNGDDLLIYTDDSRTAVRAVLHHLRQQNEKPSDRHNQCLTDFVAPASTGVADYIGAFAVTAGQGIEERLAEYEAAHDDYNAILLKALADRLAEAFAEALHAQVRREWWGYAAGENLTHDALIAERYRGIRPAPGYPACPDHTEKAILFDLLQVTERTGISLTESYAMLPTAAVSGFYFSHPDSVYFAVGKIGRDQVEDYARRKGWTLEQAEYWLAPQLAYTPAR
ncbi:MAG: methionine synthase, partial [Ferrovum sp.]|nr:methionine synthase [Ferrovum sp.]